MSWNAALRLASLSSLVLVLLSACRPQATPPSGVQARTAAPSPEVVAAVPLDTDAHTIGAGKSFGGLTVFPVLAKSQPNLGSFTTLDDALQAKTAEVREQDGSAQVNSLVIENKGKSSVFVLAGTMVKGGKQDRQIGQDFVVGSGQTVAVDAFCVEHGRWTTEREGQVTQGKFGTMQTLANSQVRAAGQHKKSQGEVWSKVAETNAATGKAPATGTLMATIEDKDVAARRKALVDGVNAHLDALEPQHDVVGVAYAVDGKVKGVRWFANHDLYRLFRATLVNTAAVETLSSPKPAADAKAPPPATAAQVKAFVTEVSTSARTEQRDTRGDNVNDYQESKTGYGAKTKLKSAPPRRANAGSGASTPAAASPAAPASTVDLSVDLVAM